MRSSNTVLTLLLSYIAFCDAFNAQMKVKTNLPSLEDSKYSKALLKKTNSRIANSRSALFSSTAPSNNVSNNKPSVNSERSVKRIRERILEISNFASLLCVLDCTILPIITLALPLLGVGASDSTAKWLHELGHSAAIFFVLPVGGLATVMNFLNHKKKELLSLALVGLTFVYAANGHGGPILSLLPHELAHSLHCGTMLHRVTNILGCACLLTSNYLGRQIAGCGSKDCGVDHGTKDINGDHEACAGHGGGHSHTHSH